MAIKKLNGNDYIVFIDTETVVTAPKGLVYKPLMCMTSNGVNLATDSIDTSDKCSGDFADPLPGTTTATITGSGNAIDETLEPSAVSFQELFDLASTKAVFWVKIANKVGNTDTPIIREGVAFISDYTETQDTNTPFTFDVTFAIKGKLNGTPIV